MGKSALYKSRYLCSWTSDLRAILSNALNQRLPHHHHHPPVAIDEARCTALPPLGEVLVGPAQLDPFLVSTVITANSAQLATRFSPKVPPRLPAAANASLQAQMTPKIAVSNGAGNWVLHIAKVCYFFSSCLPKTEGLISRFWLFFFF